MNFFFLLAARIISDNYVPFPSLSHLSLHVSLNISLYIKIYLPLCVDFTMIFSFNLRRREGRGVRLVPVPRVWFLPVVPPGHDKISGNCNKMVTTHSYAVSGASSITGQHATGRSLITSRPGDKQNF